MILVIDSDICVSLNSQTKEKFKCCTKRRQQLINKYKDSPFIEYKWKNLNPANIGKTYRDRKVP
jgi:hypothetical protein